MTHTDREMPFSAGGMARRTILKSAAALPPLLAASGAMAASGPIPEGFDRLEALVKMRGSTDGRLGFSWIAGTRFAQVGQDMRPMCGLLNCTLNRYTRIAEDAFELRLYEMSFYTDPATGRYSPELAMPFTEKRVEVPLYRTGPGRHVVKTANREEMTWSRANTTSKEAAAKLAPDGKILYEVDLSQPTFAAGEVWLSTDATTRLVPYSSDEKAWFYKEMISNHARLEGLMNPALTSVDSVASYSLVMDWRPWMQMDGIEGRTIDHAIGGRVWRLADLPADILEHMEEHHPDVTSDPGKWLDL